MASLSKSVTSKILALVLASFVLAGCQRELYSGLTEKEAAEILVVLTANQITATRQTSVGGGQTISVEDADQARAIQILAAAGLPNQRFSSLGQVFDGSGIVSTPTEERARLMYALSEEVSQSISKIDGIQSARALISIPEKDRVGGKPMPPRASVYVYHRAGRDISALIPSIKSLVANSVEGLNYEDVAVEVFPAQGATAVPSKSRGLNLVSLPFTTILIFMTCMLLLAAVARYLLGGLVRKPT